MTKKASFPLKENNALENSLKPGGAWDTGGQTRIREGEKILLVIYEHPFIDNSLKSFFAVLLIICACILSYLILPNPLTFVFVFLFFIITNTSFFMPSRYTLTEDKLVMDRIIYRKSYVWTRFRSFFIDKNGVYLSPYSDLRKFDCFRGVFLIMGSKNKSLIKPILEEKIAGPPLQP